MITRALLWTVGLFVLAAVVSGCVDNKQPASLTGDAHDLRTMNDDQGVVDINGNLP